MSEKRSKTSGGSIEETRQYHVRYLRAVSHPVRKEILRALESGSATFEDLQSRTGLDKNALKWHLGILEHDYCIERDLKQGKPVYKLTKEGRVVEYLE